MSGSTGLRIVVGSDDAQVLCVGEPVIGLELAREPAREWLGCTFDPASASAEEVDATRSYEAPAG